MSKKVGRKSLEAGASPRIGVLIPLTLETKLRQYCRAYNISLSDFIRASIVEKLDSLNKK
jgi:hypothetical protein